MLNLKGNNIEACCKHAFSLAEMMVVLLIISFLILALPPIVHKKVAKRITRGEHGRYECWKDPETGALKEYYATEKAGVIKGGTVANPVGENVAECRFKPKEMAPNAAYFAFQVIGGGAGGSYPIYDAASTVYKNPAHEDKAEVLMNMICCEGEYDNSNHYGNCKKDWGHEGTSSTQNKICFNYEGSLNYWAQQVQTRDWILKYWVPPANDREIEICSGNGATGSPTRSSDGDGVAYGGKGGDGVCARLPIGGIRLGSDNKLVFDYTATLNETYYTVDEAVPTYHKGNKYYRGRYTSDGIRSWEFPEKDVNDITVDDHYLWTTNSQGYGWWQFNRNVETCYTGYTSSSYGGCGARTNRMYATIVGDATVNSGVGFCKLDPGSVGRGATEYDGLTSWEYQTRFADTVGDRGETLLATRGADAVVTDENCPAPWVSAGVNSYESAYSSADPYLIRKQGRIQMYQAYVGAPKTLASARTYNGYDVYSSSSAAYNSKNSYLHSYNNSLNSSGLTNNANYNPFFPKRIDLSYTFGYDTPTFGYAGTPGSSMTTFLSDLPEELKFELGAGGTEGTAGSHTGGNGGDTVIKSGTGETILIAKGGNARPGGEAAAKIKMFGINTCADLPTKRKIDGCLDAGVALYNDSTKMRFAVDSGFYTVLELNSETKTPSAIYNLYSNKDSAAYLPMPGTAGDGGYSFIRDAYGEEGIKYSGYTADTQKNAVIPITVSFADGEHTYNVEFSDGNGFVNISHGGIGYETAGFVDNNEYKCYRRYDQLDNPTGATVSSSETVCKPGKGYPGAVVIVW